VSTPSTSEGTGQGHSATPMLKRKNLFGYVDLLVTAEQATRANFKISGPDISAPYTRAKTKETPRHPFAMNGPHSALAIGRHTDL
jgi:hypothetical protein